MKWQILIPTIPHRHAKLVALLDVLAAQMDPQVEVLIYHDNLQATYAEKLQALADAATADYTSHLADDDSVSPVFIPRILEAVKDNPDYVGFYVRYSEHGNVQGRVIHSLARLGWYTNSQEIVRDLMYYNPLRRELAERVKFRGRACDTEWADDLRGLEIVENEVFIPEEMYYYQHDVTDDFYVPREPMPVEAIPPHPEYPFVRYICVHS